ncbi:MAG: hypothetical protein WA254_03540 [Candidatus Sulfotelmatobacter sp.]
MPKKKQPPKPKKSVRQKRHNRHKLGEARDKVIETPSLPNAQEFADAQRRKGTKADRER